MGPRGRDDPERPGYRHGKEDRQLTLAGGVGGKKPRARTNSGEELELESFRYFASRDLPPRAAPDRMPARLSTRRYRAGLEPVGVDGKAITRSSISRRFVSGTTRKLQELINPISASSTCWRSSLTASRPPSTRSMAGVGADADGRLVGVEDAPPLQQPPGSRRPRRHQRPVVAQTLGLQVLETPDAVLVGEARNGRIM